jgi:hypothetical protein
LSGVSFCRLGVFQLIRAQGDPGTLPRSRIEG